MNNCDKSHFTNFIRARNVNIHISQRMRRMQNIHFNCSQELGIQENWRSLEIPILENYSLFPLNIDSSTSGKMIFIYLFFSITGPWWHTTSAKSYALNGKTDQYAIQWAAWKVGGPTRFIYRMEIYYKCKGASA